MSAEGERVDAEAVSIEQWINGHIEASARPVTLAMAESISAAR